jgi:hypothetical protein
LRKQFCCLVLLLVFRSQSLFLTLSSLFPSFLLHFNRFSTKILKQKTSSWLPCLQEK